MTKNETLKQLFEDNGLNKEDVFVMELGGRKIPIIKREGIEKIQAKNQISVAFELLKCSDDHTHCVVKAIGTQGSLKIESFGEASATNLKGGGKAYPIAMAEKRALSRVVLKMCGFYAQGVYGQDEAEEFVQPND